MFTSMSPLEKFSVPSVAKFRRFPGEHWRERSRVVRPEDGGLEILVNIEETKTSAGHASRRTLTLASMMNIQQNFSRAGGLSDIAARQISVSSVARLSKIPGELILPPRPKRPPIRRPAHLP